MIDYFSLTSQFLYPISSLVAHTNDVALDAFSDVSTKLHISAGSYAVPMNDVASPMRLVNRDSITA